MSKKKLPTKTTAEKKTKLTRTQEALLDSESKYSSLFQNHPSGVFLYYPETMMILDTNPAMSDRMIIGCCLADKAGQKKNIR